jgi:hypothetical protein
MSILLETQHNPFSKCLVSGVLVKLGGNIRHKRSEKMLKLPSVLAFLNQGID